MVLDIEDVILRAAKAALTDYAETSELKQILSGFVIGTDAVEKVMEELMRLVIEELYDARLLIPYSHAVIVESIDQGLIVQHYPRIIRKVEEEEDVIELDDSDAFVPERLRVR